MKKIFFPMLLAVLLVSACLSACGTDDPEIRLTNVYPHDAASFTQGLFFRDGKLYESTGLYGKSMMYADIDIQTGVPAAACALPDEVFGEGSVVFNGNLYLLTWQEKQVFVLDPETLTLRDTLPYGRDGWGLTTDGKQLIASDGSSSLFFMDEQLQTTRVMTVTRNGKPIVNLNELEYIDGVIWANIWYSDEIILIDPKSGKVIRTLDLRKTLPEDAFPKDNNAVLNGIAWNPETKKLYLTGKLWPKLYEFEIR